MPGAPSDSDEAVVVDPLRLPKEHAGVDDGGEGGDGGGRAEPAVVAVEETTATTVGASTHDGTANGTSASDAYRVTSVYVKMVGIGGIRSEALASTSVSASGMEKREGPEGRVRAMSGVYAPILAKGLDRMLNLRNKGRMKVKKMWTVG